MPLEKTCSRAIRVRPRPRRGLRLDPTLAPAARRLPRTRGAEHGALRPRPAAALLAPAGGGERRGFAFAFGEVVLKRLVAVVDVDGC